MEQKKLFKLCVNIKKLQAKYDTFLHKNNLCTPHKKLTERFKILLVICVCLTTKTKPRDKIFWCEWQILPKTKKHEILLQSMKKHEL